MSKTNAISEASMHPRHFLDYLQSAITHRLEHPYGGNAPVAYEFTQDRAMLHQYYLLRAKMHDTMFDAAPIPASEDLHDKLSHVLVARRGKLCLGGLRLTIREADESWALPLEHAEFTLHAAFPHLPLAQLRHAEISGFALMEDCGEKGIAEQLCKMMLDKAVSMEVAYLFARSNVALARTWTQMGTESGAPAVSRPEAPHAQSYITLFDLTPFYPFKNSAQTARKTNLSLVE